MKKSYTIYLGFHGERITDFIKSLFAALQYDTPLPFIDIVMRKISTISDINWKPNFNRIFYYLVFMVLTNNVILLKIASYQYIPEMKVEQEKNKNKRGLKPCQII